MLSKRNHSRALWLIPVQFQLQFITINIFKVSAWPLSCAWGHTWITDHSRQSFTPLSPTNSHRQSVYCQSELFSWVASEMRESRRSPKDMNPLHWAAKPFDSHESAPVKTKWPTIRPEVVRCLERLAGTTVNGSVTTAAWSAIAAHFAAVSGAAGSVFNFNASTFLTTLCRWAYRWKKNTYIWKLSTVYIINKVSFNL